MSSQAPKKHKLDDSKVLQFGDPSGLAPLLDKEAWNDLSLLTVLFRAAGGVVTPSNCGDGFHDYPTMDKVHAAF
jgi:hypothetical protein